MGFNLNQYIDALEFEISELESRVQEDQYDNWDDREYLCAKMDGLDLALKLVRDENA